MALRCSIRYLIVVHRQPPLSGLTTSEAEFAAPRADSHCPTSLLPLTRLELRRDGSCVCLHALSSFQRTDISRRPGRLAHNSRWLRLSSSRRLRRPHFGEPTEITIAAPACQPLFASHSKNVSKPSGFRLLREQLTFVRVEIPSDEPGSIPGEVRLAV